MPKFKPKNDILVAHAPAYTLCSSETKKYNSFYVLWWLKSQEELQKFWSKFKTKNVESFLVALLDNHYWLSFEIQNPQSLFITSLTLSRINYYEVAA